MPYLGFEIDHDHVDLSTSISSTGIELMLATGWSNRHINIERPQGYLNSIIFLLSRDEAINLRDWLNKAIEEVE